MATKKVVSQRSRRVNAQPSHAYCFCFHVSESTSISLLHSSHALGTESLPKYFEEIWRSVAADGMMSWNGLVIATFSFLEKTKASDFIEPLKKTLKELHTHQTDFNYGNDGIVAGIEVSFVNWAHDLTIAHQTANTVDLMNLIKFESVLKEMPLLDVAYLPQPDDKRKLTSPRRLVFSKVRDFLQSRIVPDLEKLHDPFIPRFQRILDKLNGHACNDKTENAELARLINRMADAFGIALYCKDADGTDHCVRIICDYPAGWPTGRFVARTMGSHRKSIKFSPTWPDLRARSISV